MNCKTLDRSYELPNMIYRPVKKLDRYHWLWYTDQYDSSIITTVIYGPQVKKGTTTRQSNMCLQLYNMSGSDGADRKKNPLDPFPSCGEWKDFRIWELTTLTMTSAAIITRTHTVDFVHKPRKDAFIGLVTWLEGLPIFIVELFSTDQDVNIKNEGESAIILSCARRPVRGRSSTGRENTRKSLFKTARARKKNARER